MSLKLSGWNDTIVALATPPGIGAIGIIRLSGEKAIEIVNQLFPSKNLMTENSHTLHVGIVKNKTEILDEVVISIYKAPRSYTGENIIEISCHGSPFIHQQVIEACIQNGARLAKPGEFTQRAFLNGKLDLTQAEAVADLIASNTTAAHKTAVNNIRGGFSNALKNLREQLIKFSALVELELDFSQEDVEFADRTQLKLLIGQAITETAQLLQSFKLGNVIKNGVSVAIIGKPNSGKSTLLNILLNEERSIVSDIPGTTRDTVEEVINIGGILFRLIDTAGIRAYTTDTIEYAGIERSLQKMQQSDFVIYLFDVNEMTREELEELSKKMQEQGIYFFLVGNKVDMLTPNAAKERFPGDHILFISAKTHWHTEELKEKMLSSVISENVQGENVIVTNARHYQFLQQAYNSLQEIEAGLDNKMPGDLLALDIRLSLQYLGEITGEITNEDQLDYIFSKFCIGK
jgi:tRNA modification GTPase